MRLHLIAVRDLCSELEVPDAFCLNVTDGTAFYEEDNNSSATGDEAFAFLPMLQRTWNPVTT